MRRPMRDERPGSQGPASPGMQAAAAGLGIDNPYLHRDWGGVQPWPSTPPPEPRDPPPRSDVTRPHVNFRPRPRRTPARPAPPLPPTPALPRQPPPPAWLSAERAGADCVGPGTAWTWEGTGDD